MLPAMTKPIPISAARRIAEAYGYDQVVVIARKVGPDGREHVTTYGVDRGHCGVAAQMGDHLKHAVMGWPRPSTAVTEPQIRWVDVAWQRAIGGWLLCSGMRWLAFVGPSPALELPGYHCWMLRDGTTVHCQGEASAMSSAQAAVLALREGNVRYRVIDELTSDEWKRWLDRPVTETEG